MNEGFDVKPYQLRKAAVNEKTGKEDIAKAAQLAHHKKQGITDKYYFTDRIQFGNKTEEEIKE